MLEATEAKLFIRASLKNLSGADPPDDEVDAKFNEVDENGDGVLTWSPAARRSHGIPVRVKSPIDLLLKVFSF